MPTHCTGSRELERFTQAKLRLGAYNARGLKTSFEEIKGMLTQLDAPFVRETWIRNGDTDLMKMIDEHVHNLAQTDVHRGFEGVAVIVNPLLRYKVVAK